MKNKFFILWALAPMLISAQNNENPCAQYENLFENKVAENIALKAHVQSLAKDSTSHVTLITALRNDSAQTHTQLNEARNKLSVSESTCIKLQELVAKVNDENNNLKNQLSTRTSLTMQQYKDSIVVLNKQVNMFADSIGKLQASVTSLGKDIQRQKNELKQLTAIAELLAKRYEKSSVDELYSRYDMGELKLYKDLCPLVGKKVPANVEQAIICHRAQEQLKLKYDRIQVEKLQKQLLQDSKIGKKLFTLMQQYAEVNSEAFALWNQIKEDFGPEPIENESFPQIQAKRQIWQKSQKFLNKYPSLSTDYPYIQEQIQSMLREIWTNANNFNRINNPFK